MANDSIINSLISLQLSKFIRDYSITPPPLTQDLRSLSITWLCRQFPKEISEENQMKIQEFVDNQMYGDDYAYTGWYRLPALQAAVYGFLKDEYYIESILKGISTEESTIRAFLLRSLSLLTSDLEFENDLLRQAVEEDLERDMWYATDAAILLISTRGSNADKRKWIEQQSEKNPKFKDFFQNLLQKDALVDNEFFYTNLSEIKEHLLMEIIKNQGELSLGSTGVYGLPADFIDKNPLNRIKLMFDFS